MADINPRDIHAEHVGSLLRQPWLLAARADRKAGTITEGELRAAEDRAAAENIETQRSAGIGVFTDGEVRRTNWMTGILESIGGMTPIETPPVTWHRPDGEIPPEEETDFVMTVTSSKVFQKEHLTAVEARYMVAHAPGPFKVTMMSAAMGGMTWRPEVSAAAYPDPAELVGDLVALQVAEVAEQPLRLHGQGRLCAGRGAAVRRGARGPVPARVRRRAVRRVRAAALRPAGRDRGARPGFLQDAGARIPG